MIKRIVAWIVTLCRIGIGTVVIKTGYNLAAGNGPFSYRETDAIAGIFIILIGAYFILSSLFPDLFDRPE